MAGESEFLAGMGRSAETAILAKFEASRLHWVRRRLKTLEAPPFRYRSPSGRKIALARHSSTRQRKGLAVELVEISQELHTHSARDTLQCIPVSLL